ncbi:AMP-binding protein, partial [Nocardia sp. NPDC050789]|uniref:AMP-binding protein n=1 Tax=Nocardia sp. NPDC050789 TaxID=3154841 RepID=UPI0033F3688F
MTHAATRLHEYHSAPIPSTSAPASMAATVYRHREQSPDLVLFQRPRADDRWLDVTASDFADEVLAVAKGLIASGIQVGDRVAIHSATRYEWVLLDYAIWAVGACTVAVYDSSAADQVRWILRDSGAALLITETERHRALAIEASTDAPDLREILTIDADAVGELVRRGTDLDDAAVRQRLRQIG